MHFGQFYSSLPKDARLVGIELDERSVPLAGYRHPERAVYLLGSETDGLSQEALEHCADVVQIPGEFSLNVSVAGSIVLYDRLLKNGGFWSKCLIHTQGCKRPKILVAPPINSAITT